MSVPKNNISTLVDAKIQLALPELTDIFIADLETRLHQEKVRIRKEISEAKAALEKHQEVTARSINFNSFLKGGFPALDITAKFGESEPGIHWKKGECNRSISIVQGKGKNSTRIGTVTVTLPVKKSDIKKHEGFNEMITQLNEDLNSVLTQISELPRKERLVRARISKMKLEADGHTDLLKDKTLLQLVQLD